MKANYFKLKNNKHFVNLFTLFFVLASFFISIPIFAKETDGIPDWTALYQHKFYSAVIFQLEKDFTIEKDLKNYVLGTSYFFLSEYNEAKIYLQSIKSSNFKFINDPVGYYLGMIYFFEKNYAKSVSYFNEISADYDNLIEKDKFFYYFGLALNEVGKYDLALKYLKIGLESEYENFKPYYSFTIGKIYYNLADFSNAVAEFEKFLYKYVDSTLIDDTLYYLGKSYYALNDLKNAKRAFSSIYNLYKTSEYFSSSIYYLGLITGNKIYFEEIISKYPNFEKIDYAYYYLAKIQFDEKDNDGSYKNFSKCFDISNNQDLIYNCIVYMIKIKGDIPIFYLERLNEQQRKVILEYLLNSYLYFNQREKIKNLENSIYIDEINRNSATLFIFGKFYLRENNIEKSLSYFSKALALNPVDYRILFFNAYCYLQLGNLEFAQKLFEKVLYEKNLEAYYGYYSYLYLGTIEIKKQSYKTAIYYFEQIILKYPTYPSLGEVYYFLSVSYYNIHDYNKSLKAIELAYKSPVYGKYRLAFLRHYSIVLLRFDLAKSLSIFEEYVSCEENKSEIYQLAMKLADYSFTDYKYDYAMILYKYASKFAETNKQVIDSNIQIIMIYYNQKNYDKAYENIKSILSDSLSYRKKDILFVFFSVAIQLEDETAAQYFNQLNEGEIKDFSNFIFPFITIFQKKGKYEEALNFIDFVLDKTKDNPSLNLEILSQKAYLLKILAKNDEAFALYESLLEQANEDKKVEIELQLIELATKLKNYEYLSSQIEPLLNYNDTNLDSSAFYLLLKLFLKQKIDKNYIYKIANQYPRLNKYKYFEIFIQYLQNQNDIKKQTDSSKKYVTSSNQETAFWGRLFYSFALFDNNDTKNSKAIAESLLTVADREQKEIIYYLLVLIEKSNGKEKNYWNLFTQEYPESILL